MTPNRRFLMLAVTAGALILNFMSTANAQKTIWPVKITGAMRDMYETGNIDGKIEIGKLTPANGLYGLGPLGGLTGEIMIWNGEPLTCFMSGAEVKAEVNNAAAAVFFVSSNVLKWKEFPVPASVATYDQLEKFIGETAAAAKFSDVAPVPFLLKGTFGRVDWHVNNYKSDGGKITHEKHDAAKVRRTSENAALEMLGFYSTRHAGIFVHHTRSSHIHATDAKRTFVGHVDDLKTFSRVILYLPAN